MTDPPWRTIVVLEGDQTGQELLLEALRVIDPAVTRLPLTLVRFDLSLGNRRRTRNQVVRQAAEAMRQSGLGLKAAMTTPDGQDDVSSPDPILREAMDATILLHTGRRLPGVLPAGGVHAPICVLQMAAGDAHGAREWRKLEEDGDEIAQRIDRISRRTCRAVAEFSFQHAEKTGAKVFGGPNYTVSPVYEGMFKEELDAAALRHPAVRYEPHLIDATYALLLHSAGEALVIPALNRDGDCLSDLVLQLYGSTACAESMILALDDNPLRVRVAMAEAPHGTAPALQAKNIASPVGMILASAALLSYLGTPEADRASSAIYEATFGVLAEGIATPDLGGNVGTTGFTDEVIRRVGHKLDSGEALA